MAPCIDYNYIDLCYSPGRRVELRIGADKYQDHLISNGSITVRAQGRVVETSESFVVMDNFIVKPPELSVEVRNLTASCPTEWCITVLHFVFTFMQ